MTLKTTGNAAHAPSFLCCLFLFCFFPAGAQAQPAVCHLPAGFQSISTLACTSVLTDPDHRYTAAKAFEALSEGKFVPYTTPGNILKQRKAQATWLSFSIHNQTGDTLDLIFLFKDLKEAWRIDERNLKKIPHAGHHVVYDVSGLLTLPERMFFTYQLPPASSETFLCLSDYPLPNKSIAPEVFEIRSFERAKNKELRFVTLFNGMIFGAGLMVVFMSLIFYWQVRDRILPAYALYIFVFLVYLWRDFEYMDALDTTDLRAMLNIKSAKQPAMVGKEARSKYPWLQPGETVAYFSRRHWIAFLGKNFLTFVFLFILLVFAAVGYTLPGVQDWITAPLIVSSSPTSRA